MRKKIIITMFIIITILQTIIPIQTNAFAENREIISVPAKIEKQKTEIVSETTGLDAVTGVILEPTLAFFTFIIDSVMGVFSSFMTQSDYESVMIDIDDDELEKLTDIEGSEVTYTISDMTPYENAFGHVNIEYPNFSYSPEEIFAGNLDLLDVNFIDDSNQDEDWKKIRSIVSSWYKVLRMVSIIGLLSVLIYTGIKIIISSNTKDKAKYKEMLINWFIAVFLAFTMHYIMAFILSIIEEVCGLLQGISGAITVDAGGKIFKTNLIGLARFQMQQQHFSDKLGNLVIYMALVAYTFKFTFMYLKRVLRMAFLTVIAPIVALTYPIDKMNGKAKGFEMWLKEYIYNALLQPMHYILYYILVTSSITLAARNPIYGIAALLFISHAERLLKRIFGFDKASAGTVGGLAGAYATGTIVSKLKSWVKNPLYPFGGGKESKKSSGGQSGNNSYDEDFYNNFPIGTRNDTNVESFLGINTRRQITSTNLEGAEDSSNQEEQITQDSSMTLDEKAGPTLPGLDDFISRYRASIDPNIHQLMGGLHFDDNDSSMDDILKQYYQNLVELGKYSDIKNLSPEQIQLKQQTDDELSRLKNVLQYRIMANEANFKKDQLQYIDGESNNTGDLVDEMIELLKKASNPSLPSNERRGYLRQAQNLMKKIKRRMLQNQYIEQQGGPQALLQNERERLLNYSEIDSTNPMVSSLAGSNPKINMNTSQRQVGNETGQQAIESENRERHQQVKETENGGTQQQIKGQENKNIQQTNEDGEGRRYTRVRKQAGENIRRVIPNRRRQLISQGQPIEQDEEKQEQEKNENPLAPVVRGIKHVGKTIIKPAWDGEKDPDVNAKNLAENIAKGIAGVTVGIAAATVQAGISITDGKYNPIEGVATVGAGIVGVSKLGQSAGGIAQIYREGSAEGDDQRTLEEYGKQWFNRDDVIVSYNREFPGEGKSMRRRALNNYVTRGITDVKEQTQAIRFANQLKSERGMDEEEADRIAVATLQYRKNLTLNSNYTILFDKEKRKKYLDTTVDAYAGSASRASIRQLHEDFIENVRDFDRANR